MSILYIDNVRMLINMAFLVCGSHLYASSSTKPHNTDSPDLSEKSIAGYQQQRKRRLRQ